HASDGERHCSGLNVGKNSKGTNVGLVTRLDIDGLPDTAGGRVPAPLLADGLLRVIHGVLDAQHEQSLKETIAIGQGISEIEFERSVSAFVVTKMCAIAPTVGEKIRRADVKDDTFVFPGLVIGQEHIPAVPTHFVARCGAVIGAVNLKRIEEDASGIEIVIACGIASAPGGEGFPTKGHNDLLAPVWKVGLKPALVDAFALAVKTELPWSVQIQPIVSLDQSALTFRPRIFRTGMEKIEGHRSTH